MFYSYLITSCLYLKSIMGNPQHIREENNPFENREIGQNVNGFEENDNLEDVNAVPHGVIRNNAVEENNDVGNENVIPDIAINDFIIEVIDLNFENDILNDNGFGGNNDFEDENRILNDNFGGNNDFEDDILDDDVFEENNENENGNPNDGGLEGNNDLENENAIPNDNAIRRNNDLENENAVPDENARRFNFANININFIPNNFNFVLFARQTARNLVRGLVEYIFMKLL